MHLSIRKISYITFVVAIVGLGFWSISGFSQAPTVDESLSYIVKPIQKKSINIGWVGDITPVVMSEKPEDFIPFNKVASFLLLPDIMVGNLEGVITEETVSKCKPEMMNCFSFRGDDVFVQHLVNAGFDIMNIANNHAFDFGKASFINTKSELLTKGISSTGSVGEITILEKNGIKVAFVGFAPNVGTNPFLDGEHIKKNITEAKEQADIVIVIMHAGGEGKNYTHVKDLDEIYLNENRGNTFRIAHSIIDAGADAVLGSGPHVLRGIELYKGKMIAYSMGNFFASSHLSTRDILKFSGILSFDIDKTGALTGGTFTPIIIGINGVPSLDLDLTSIKSINQLSLEDFGQNALILDQEGNITVR